MVELQQKTKNKRWLAKNDNVTENIPTAFNLSPKTFSAHDLITKLCFSQFKFQQLMKQTCFLIHQTAHFWPAAAAGMKLLPNQLVLTAAGSASSFTLSLFCEHDLGITQMGHPPRRLSWLSFLEDQVQVNYLLLEPSTNHLSDHLTRLPGDHGLPLKLIRSSRAITLHHCTLNGFKAKMQF